MERGSTKDGPGTANEAPAYVGDWVPALPAGWEYGNASPVWQALGGGREEQT